MLAPLPIKHKFQYPFWNLGILVLKFSVLDYAVTTFKKLSAWSIFFTWSIFLPVLWISCYLEVFMQVVSVPSAFGWQYPSLSTETSYIFGNNKLNSCRSKSCGYFFHIEFCRRHPFLVKRRWPPQSIRSVWKKKKEMYNHK